jgi:uncharacterized protein YrrD
MQYKQGATVMSSDGKDVGRIDRVVFDPKSKEISHIVIRQGFLFTEDKVVPVELVASATEENVYLRQSSEQLKDLPLFEETHYLAYNESDPNAPAQLTDTAYAEPLLWYPPVGPVTSTGWTYGVAPYTPYYPLTTTPGVTQTVRNIPDNAVALKEGAKVVSANGDHVGNVERLLTEQDRVTHILISQGFLFTTEKLIPISWINTVADEQITLSVASRTLENLPEYEKR